MILFMKIFTEIRFFDNDNVNMIISQEIRLIQINTIQINLNDKMLKVKNVKYISNITSNFLSIELLKKQEFDFNLIFKTDSEKQFKITDTQNQIFHVIKININVYKIIAVKTKLKFKIKQKFKNKLISTFIENDNITEFK